MTLVNAECVCGLCETIGQNVKQTPETISRILQALNLSKLPAALTTPELNERVGLCNKCERQIKLLEEAASIRENLKESLLSNLQHLSTSDGYPPKSRFVIKGESSECFTNPYSYRIQQTNEVTPNQHSIKRKISNIVNWSLNSHSEAAKRKHLKAQTQAYQHQVIGLNGAVSGMDPNNSSDEENALMINESSSVSPHSSIGSYTPPPASSPTYNAHHQPTSDAHQVLSELTCGRNRRKQARPAKAAGNVVPAVPHQNSFEFSPYTSLRTPTSSRSPYNTSIGGTVPTPRSRQSTPIPPPATPQSGNVVVTPPPPTSLSQPQNPSTMFDINAGKFSLLQQQQFLLQAVPNYSANLLNPQTLDVPLSSSAALPPRSVSSSAAASAQSALPFTYASLYQNNINLLNSQSMMQSQAGAASSDPTVNASALILQSLYHAAASASKPGLMAAAAANNPMMFAGTLRGVTNGALQFNKPSTGSSRETVPTKSDTSLLMSTKKEPKVPLFSYGPPPPPKSSGGAKSAVSADAHTLVKTDKRRYCKVCTSSMRKANNGRPPQSRFLCLVCNMPMCRSCIEEHRYRVMMKCNDVKSDIKPSASAKLLQAVKMKDNASGGRKTQSSPSSSLLSGSRSIVSPTSSSAAPPSHSSLIYGSMSSTTLPTTPPSLSPAHSSGTEFAQHNISSMLPTLPTLTAATPLDMRLSAYKPIAPAPFKTSSLTTPMETLTISSKNVKKEDVADEDECDEKPLVISECDEKPPFVSECASAVPATPEADESHAMGEDQTDITPEVASKTVAMLMAMDDEAMASVGSPHNDDQTPQSSIPITKISSEERCSNDIPTNDSAIEGNHPVNISTFDDAADKENQKYIL